MTEFFNAALDFFTNIGTYITNIIDGLATILFILPVTQSYAGFILGMLPGLIAAYMGTMVIIAIAFRIIGR